MLNWCKRALRNWLFDGAPPAPTSKKPDMSLDCLSQGKRVTYRIVGCRGMMLMGMDSKGTRLINAGQACDQDDFFCIWSFLNQGAKATWEEDGATIEMKDGSQR